MAFLLAAACPAAWAAESRASESAGQAILVAADGTVTVPTNIATVGWPGTRTVRQVSFAFGLPAGPPERRWRDEDAPGVTQTSWVKNGIRYTQKVLVTALGTNDPARAGPSVEGSVLLVQVMGHNAATEYTEAQATVSVQADGRPLPLELRGGLVFVSGPAGGALVAALDVPSEGIAATNGPQLRFRGSMPPGTSGSLTLKIPVGRLDPDAGTGPLQDLEFDAEAARLKRAWRARPPAAPEEWPVRWAGPGP